jgi:FecR protein
MFRLHSAVALPLIIAGIVNVSEAQAASVRAGDAVQVVQEVAGLQSGNRTWDTKAEGDDIYENEVIRTAILSQAHIVLVDRTGLSIGPITTIRVDRIVYYPNQSIKGIIVTAGSGAVRWTSGASSAYLIRTPTADITPEGTVFDLFVDDARTFVILRQGRVRVCTNDLQPTCKIIANPGEMILVTAGELQGPGRGGPGAPDFANRCLSATGENCVMDLVYRRTDIQPNRPRVTDEPIRNAQPNRPRVTDEPIRNVRPNRPRVTDEPIRNAQPNRPRVTDEPIRNAPPNRPRVTDEPIRNAQPNRPRVTVADAGSGYRCRHNGVWHAGRCPDSRNGHPVTIRCLRTGRLGHC